MKQKPKIQKSPSWGSTSPRRSKWWAFFTGLLVLWIFAFVIIPWVGSFDFVAEVMASVKANDIKASGLFYTDIDLPVPLRLDNGA